MVKTLFLSLNLFSWLLFATNDESQQTIYYGAYQGVTRGAYQSVTPHQRGHFHKSDSEWDYQTSCPFSCSEKFSGPDYEQLKTHLIEKHRAKVLDVEIFGNETGGGSETKTWQIIYQPRVSN